jgi:uncharacterized protein YjiS (DUF1127 family)
MILSHTHEFIFLCNGKTGTTSVESALGQYHEGEAFEVDVTGLYEGKHVPPAVLRGMLGPEIWSEYFTFCFVRNPWDWFVSQLFWNWEPDPISKRKLLRRPLETIREYRRKREKRAYLAELKTFSTAEIQKTFTLLRQYRAVYQADSLFQYHYAFSPGGQKLVDFVGRFERMADDFETVLDRIGVDAELPHRNPTDHRAYQSYYTEDTARLIGELYQVDIDAFSYSFDGDAPQSDP